MIPRHFDMMGADPEVFITKEDKVVSSKVLEEKYIEEMRTRGDGIKLVRDGYQGEIHFLPHTCREVIASNIGFAITKLKQLAGLGVQIGHGRWVPEDEFEELDESCKTFGCLPSLNVNGPQPSQKDARFYTFRPLGGHIHLSIPNITSYKEDLPLLIRLLDVMVGVVCVPWDQKDNDNAIERRKNYGRAGEYRLKPYGIEYRTLSNFWLENNVTLSLVFGLARQAVSIWKNDLKLAQAIVDSVPQESVVRAINTNDKSLAIELYEVIKPFFNDKDKFLVAYGEVSNEAYTLNPKTINRMGEIMRSGPVFERPQGHDSDDFWGEYARTSNRGVGIEKYLLGIGEDEYEGGDF